MFGTSARRYGLGLLVSVSACGGPSIDLHAAFASIQVDEARIENASSADEICAASTHLCETARPLDDRDATTRCERARARCAATSTP